MLNISRTQELSNRLLGIIESNTEPPALVVQGRLTRMVGLTLEADGCRAAVGDRCRISNAGNKSIEAEVVGFSGTSLFLMPTDEPHGLSPNARVTPLGKSGDVAVGPGLLGRVLNGAGQPLDNKGPLKTEARVPLKGKVVNPLNRAPIRDPLDVGVRSINSFLTVGRGQRLGLFAPSGVGKSVLLGMMTRFTDADVIVVGLIGERGREVKEFIEQSLGNEGMNRSVVVATPADDPPLMRLNGAMLATSIAEYFRDCGHNVLLLMDSLTRFAQAQREIGLTIGEPPATKGYPPSVFARLPQLVERAGNGPEGGGSITAFYTVLTEADAHNDPIADSARAILDGHVVLSRHLAEGGMYPAVDIEQSISRAMNQITTPQHQAIANSLKKSFSLYEQNRDLINVGAYQAGTDQQLDLAIKMHPYILQFLSQGMHEKVTSLSSNEQLTALYSGVEEILNKKMEN
ncbi:MAG: flagellum-specific ATP synthase [Gammaproteobacteria bacterium]|jgi:flagellum-specific ATP synthase